MFELQDDFGMLGRAVKPAAGLISPVFPAANQEPGMAPADQSQLWASPGPHSGSSPHPPRWWRWAVSITQTWG